jgi:hypothetical protein
MSISDRDVDEIIEQLSINDIYYLLYIASRWFDRMKRAEYMLRKIASDLGVFKSSSSGEDFIRSFIKQELSRMIMPQQAEPAEQLVLDSQESIEKLRRVIEMVKSKSKKAEQQEPKEGEGKK